MAKKINRILVEWPDQEKEVWDVAEGHALYFHEGKKGPWTHCTEAYGCHFYFYGREPKLTILEVKYSGVSGLLSATFE